MAAPPASAATAKALRSRMFLRVQATAMCGETAPRGGPRLRARPWRTPGPALRLRSRDFPGPEQPRPPAPRRRSGWRRPAQAESPDLACSSTPAARGARSARRRPRRAPAPWRRARRTAWPRRRRRRPEGRGQVAERRVLAQQALRFVAGCDGARRRGGGHDVSCGSGVGGVMFGWIQREYDNPDNRWSASPPSASTAIPSIRRSSRKTAILRGRRGSFRAAARGLQRSVRHDALSRMWI